MLAGEIRSFSSSPVTFGLDTFGSAFLVTVHMAVKLTRVRDGAVLWENPNYVYSERYVLNAKITDFFSEENPALERLARDFAASPGKHTLESLTLYSPSTETLSLEETLSTLTIESIFP